MTLVGFKKMVIRVLDGKTADNTNLFTIEGAKDKGATQTANISGLSSDPVKTYGSDIAYFTSRKGVGDVKVELTTVDVPFAVQNAILGRKTVDGLVVGGADTEPPLCSATLYSENAQGQTVAIGFYCGVFTMDGLELNTKKADKEELPSESLTFTAQASDDKSSKGYYYAIATDTDSVTKLETAMKITQAKA